MARALVAGGSTVAEPDVEQTVRPEGDVAAVVVGLGLVLGEDLPARRLVHRAGTVDRVLDDPGVAVAIGVVDVQLRPVG